MVTIRPATPADYSRAATTYARSFADDPVIRWLVPDDDDYAAIEQRFFGFLVRRWVAGGTLWCTDDVVAVAGWNAPGRPEVEFDRSEVELDHPPERLDKLESLGEHMAANTPDEPHWHLNMLGTHPDWQLWKYGAVAQIPSKGGA